MVYLQYWPIVQVILICDLIICGLILCFLIKRNRSLVTRNSKKRKIERPINSTTYSSTGNTGKLIKDIEGLLNQHFSDLKKLEESLKRAKEEIGFPVNNAHEDDRYQDVVKMLDQGIEAEEIVKKLKISQGEVNLIMGLRAQQEGNN